MLIYQNAQGNAIDLSCEKIRTKIKTAGLYDAEWSVKTTKSGTRNVVSSISKEPKTYEAVIDFCGSREERANSLNEFLKITEQDVCAKTPGTLYLNDCYLQCYIIGTKNAVEEGQYKKLQKTVKIYAAYPMWITEQTVEVKRLDASARDSGGDKAYPYLYPYSYRNIETAYPFTVDHYTDSDFRLTVYGPTTSVYVTIAGHPYEVAYPTGPGEKLIIDSRASQDPQRRIYLVGRDGTCVNVFRYRGEEDVFQKIPSGNVWIEYGREYDISLTLYKERSEPLWN